MRHVKYLFSTLILLFCSAAANAHDFEVDGIYYNITSKGELTVEVTNENGVIDAYRESEVIIPSSVIYDEVEYSVTRIGEFAFSHCSSLTTITIPESVTSIGIYAFSRCSRLTTITIPEGVTSIELGAFSECGSRLTSITIPESVTSIGNFVFQGCAGELIVNCNIPSASSRGAFEGSKFTKVTIGEGVTSIGNYAFSGCSSLTAITIPESVTSIGYDAFYGCTGELIVNCNIPSASSRGAFEGSKFTKVTIGDGVTSIGNYAFYGCSSLTTIAIPEGVTSIGESTFSGCSSLTTITIPEDVKSIGESAFSGCSSLITIAIPEGVTSIGESTFSGCSSLTTITIPEGVTSIGESAFSGCSSLITIAIPESVTSIESWAFSGCTGELIVNCNIPSASKYSPSAFYESKFTKVAIGDGATSIGSNAFYGCSSLTSIVLSKSLEFVGSQAFAGCPNLSNVYCYAERVPLTESDVFIDSNVENAILHVSDDALDSYKATVPWSDFGLFLPLGKYITEIELSQSSATLVEGKTLSLGVTLTPEDTDVILIAWSSSNSSVATVDKQGKVTAVAPGTAIITAAAIDGGEASDSCEVTVLYADYVITYEVDGEVYATDTITRASAVTPLEEPVKEGYSFSGWSEIPETMPGHDVTVSGTFTINKYLVTFAIDGVVITFNTQEYGTAIVPPEVSEREGYTFSGWLNLPESVPACDITINGSYTINKYLITYIVGDEVYHTDSIAYGTYITSIKNPVKEGYTFNGWGEIPEKMPTNDVTVIGTFSINKYKVTYTVDDVTHYTDSIVYGGQIKDIAEPTKEGYSFGGWEKNHQTMPAYDVVINGTFIINKYQISYVVGGETIHTDSITYNERITPIESPEQEGFTFSGWIGVPGIMPAYDVTVGGEFFIKNMQTDSQGLMYVLNEETETFELSNYEGNLTGTIVIPADLYGYPVNGVKERALMGAENLIAVVIPENVNSVGYRAFYGCNNLSYIEWETTAPVDAACFDEPARHGNLLVYVKDAATEVTYQGNVIVDGVAERIAITNEQPLRNIREFTARNITFTRQFTKKTERGVAGGWEAMIIPFDVETVTSENRGELKPFGEADFTTSLPYWIAQLQADGSFAYIDSIKANRPFIMEVPNCDEYQDIYNVEGAISFGAENVTVYATTDMNHDMGNGYTMMGNYEGTASDGYVYALNDEEYAADGDVYLPGGVFVADSRDIRPFEAYIYSNQPTAAPYLRIGKKGTTDIDNLLIQRTDDAWYNLQGVRLSGKPTERGVYIINRKKVAID